MTPCPACGRGPVTNGKILGYEDEFWCRYCGCWFTDEELMVEKATSSEGESDSSRA